MSQRLSQSLFLLLCVLLATGAMALERFPPPDFGAGYVFPQSSQAPPRAGWLAWVDTAALIAALIAAAVITYQRRSRRAMAWLSFFSLVYFGFYRKGCVCPVGAIQNVAQAAFDTTFVVPYVVLAFFALPLIFALLFGRVFCGGVCPLGALQDIVLVKPLTVPRALDRGLSVLRYFYLGLAVLLAATGTSYIICKYDPMVAFFRMSGRFNFWLWSGAVLLLSVFIGRPYCRFLCPYGALLGIFSRFSARRVSIAPETCVNCHLCREACAFGAIREGERVEEEAR